MYENRSNWAWSQVICHLDRWQKGGKWITSIWWASVIWRLLVTRLFKLRTSGRKWNASNNSNWQKIHYIPNRDAKHSLAIEISGSFPKLDTNRKSKWKENSGNSKMWLDKKYWATQTCYSGRKEFKSNGSRYTLSAENSNKWKLQKTDHEPLENSNRRKAQYDAKLNNRWQKSKLNDGNHPLNSLNKSM